MEILSSIRALTEPEADGGLTSLELRDSTPSLLLNGRQAFSLLMGGEPTASGESITETTSLKISWVYSAVRVIAETAGSLPIRIYEKTDEGETEAFEHSLSYSLLNEPNPDMSGPVMVETLVGCLALTGNCYAEILRDKRKNVIGLYPLNPLQTEPQRSDKGQLEYKTYSGQDASASRIIAAKDMIHVPLWGWNGLRGLSPIQQQAQALGFAQATLKQGARFIGNGFSPKGIVSPSGALSPEQAAQLKSTLEAQGTGNNQGRLAVFPAPMSYIQLGLSMADAAFLESRAFSRNEIAAIFRLDPHHLGDTTRQSNSNAEQATLTLMQDTMAPYLAKLATELNRKLLPMVARKRSSYVIRFDLTERLRADLKTTLETLALARQWSIMTIDEARKHLGLNPLGGQLGNSLMSPVNMMDSAKWLTWTPATKGKPKNE
jgi:HK97 family phage portal protein